MSTLILWLPMLSAFTTGVFGRYLGVTGTHFVAITFIFTTLIALLLAIFEHFTAGITHLIVAPFIQLSMINADWGILLDSLSLSLILPVVLISFCVHLYSVNYMGSDPHSQRFIAYLSLFTASMLVLVTAPSLLQLFVGWELIGLSSYLLIGFWSTRLPASQSALQAFIINRFGDVALSIAMYIAFTTFSSLNFASLLTLSSETTAYPLLTITLLIAAMAKSAQFGLQTWLPSAMEGPTPVSALIHAATLVTAGAYLLLRLSPILDTSSSMLIITGFIGSLTAVFAGTIGLVQNDLKRIIAFSTCSQIGYLFIAIGAGNYTIALFHMVNHAMFKALLFLGAGVVIHAIQDNQDIRRMGGLIYYLPLAYIALLVGSISLMALPFLTGFYSKELIIELSFVQYALLPHVLYYMATIAATLTGYYSFRLLYLTFFNKAHARPAVYLQIHNPDIIIIIPLIILLLLSVSMGYLFKDLYSGVGSDFLANVLPTDPQLTEVEFLMNPAIKIVPLFLTGIAATLALICPYFIPSNSTTYALHRFLAIKWGLDHLINRFAYFLIEYALVITKTIDRGLIEMVGPFGVSTLLTHTSHHITHIYHLSRYCLAIVFTLLFTLSLYNSLPLG